MKFRLFLIALTISVCRCSSGTCSRDLNGDGVVDLIDLTLLLDAWGPVALPSQQLWGWGWNNVGQLGDGTNVGRPAPVRIGDGTDWKLVVGGVHQSHAIKNNGTLWQWGLYGNPGGSPIPVQLGNATTWKSVVSGYYHFLGLQNDGSLWSWGFGQFGALGDGTGTIETHPLPTRVGNDFWTTVAAGFGFSLGVRADKTLWAWGRNAEGEVGDGSLENRLSPVQIGPANSKWKSVAAGQSHSLAVAEDGTLWAWGDNISGQLGNALADPNHLNYSVFPIANPSCLRAIAKCTRDISLQYCVQPCSDIPSERSAYDPSESEKNIPLGQKKVEYFSRPGKQMPARLPSKEIPKILSINAEEEKAKLQKGRRVPELLVHSSRSDKNN